MYKAIFEVSKDRADFLSTLFSRKRPDDLDPNATAKALFDRNVRFLKDHDGVVDVFYVSNVERYLFDDFAHGKQFHSNVAALPLNPSSTLFVR